MSSQKDTYLQTLVQINFALASGLKSAATFIEYIDKTTEEQRKAMIEQLKALAEANRDVYVKKQVH
jgi:hypothetical protein